MGPGTHAGILNAFLRNRNPDTPRKGERRSGKKEKKLPMMGNTEDYTKCV